MENLCEKIKALGNINQEILSVIQHYLDDATNLGCSEDNEVTFNRRKSVLKLFSMWRYRGKNLIPLAIESNHGQIRDEKEELIEFRMRTCADVIKIHHQLIELSKSYLFIDEDMNVMLKENEDEDNTIKILRDILTNMELIQVAFGQLHKFTLLELQRYFDSSSTTTIPRHTTPSSTSSISPIFPYSYDDHIFRPHQPPIFRNFETLHIKHRIQAHTDAAVWALEAYTIRREDKDIQFLASGSASNSIKVWDLTFLIYSQNQQKEDIITDEKPIPSFSLLGHKDTVTSLQAYDDLNEGKCLCSASADKSIKLWSLEGSPKRCLATLTGHSEIVRALAVYYSIDQNDSTKVLTNRITPYLCSAGNDSAIHIWNLETHTLIQTLNGHSHNVILLRTYYENIGSEGVKSRLCTGSVDKTCRIYCLQTYTLIQTLNGHQDSIRSLAILQLPIIKQQAQKQQKFHRVQNKTDQDHCEKRSGESKTILANGTGDHKINLWKLDTSKYSSYESSNDKNENSVNEVFMKDCSHLAKRKKLITGDCSHASSPETLQEYIKIKSLKTDHTGLIISLSVIQKDGYPYLVSGSFETIKIWRINYGFDPTMNVYEDGDGSDSNRSTSTGPSSKDQEMKSPEEQNNMPYVPPEDCAIQTLPGQDGFSFLSSLIAVQLIDGNACLLAGGKFLDPIFLNKSSMPTCVCELTLQYISVFARKITLGKSKFGWNKKTYVLHISSKNSSPLSDHLEPFLQQLLSVMLSLFLSHLST